MGLLLAHGGRPSGRRGGVQSPLRAAPGRTALCGERVVRGAGFRHPPPPGTAPEHALAPGRCVCVWGGNRRTAPQRGAEIAAVSTRLHPVPGATLGQLRAVEERARPRTSPCPGAERRDHVLPCAGRGVGAGRGAALCGPARTAWTAAGASWGTAPERRALIAAVVQRSCLTCAGAARSAVRLEGVHASTVLSR